MPLKVKTQFFILSCKWQSWLSGCWCHFRYINLWHVRAWIVDKDLPVPVTEVAWSSSWRSTGACVMDNMRNLQDGVCQHKSVTLVKCFCGQWGKGEFVDAVFLQMHADSLSQTCWTSWRLYSSVWEHTKVVVSQADGWCRDLLFVVHERLCVRRAELGWTMKGLGSEKKQLLLH